MREWVIKYRKLLTAATVLLLIAASGWYFITNKAVKVLQDTLVSRANQEINGRLDIGSMDLSFSGKFEIRDVELFDTSEKQLLRIPLLQLSYRLNNLMDGNLDVSRIESVTLHKAGVWLQEENGGWNWEHVLKKSKPDDKPGENGEKSGGQDTSSDSAKFKGKIEIKDSTISLKTADFSREISNIGGEADFKDYPAAAINLQGKIGTAVLKSAGVWGGTSPGEIVITSDEVELTQFKDLIKIAQDVQLENGKLKNVKVTVKQGADKNINTHALGEFTELGLSGKFDISEGAGKFSGDAKEAQFPEISLKISGQQVTGQGKVTFPHAGTGDKDTAALDFDIAIPDLDPAQFLSGVDVNRPVALRLRLTGPATAPVVAGNASISGVKTGDITISGITGDIRYADNRLLVEKARGSVYQGTLFLAGVVLPESKNYEFDVSGSGIDSSRMVDMDIEGPLDFSGRLNGRNEDVTIRGNFVIKDGKAYGLSFKALTGKFTMHGNKTDITDIAITTALGTIYPEKLSREALDKARQRITDRNIPTTKEEATKVLTDKLRQRLGR